MSCRGNEPAELPDVVGGPSTANADANDNANANADAAKAEEEGEATTVVLRP
jgi:hypothetical protein